MAVRQFAIPLDDSSVQSGDITFKELRDNGAVVKFDLTNTAQGSMESCTLNLITKKGGSTTSHSYSVTFVGGTAKVELSTSAISDIYDDADGGDWDYIEAEWTVGVTDTPTTSVMHETQSGHVYDFNGWPPNK